MKSKVICAGRSHDSTVCPASDDLQRAADSDSGRYKLHSHIKTPAECADERSLPQRFTQESVKLKPDEGSLVTLHHTGTCGHVRLKVTDGSNRVW